MRILGSKRAQKYMLMLAAALMAGRLAGVITPSDTFGSDLRAPSALSTVEGIGALVKDVKGGNERIRKSGLRDILTKIRVSTVLRTDDRGICIWVGKTGGIW